MATTFDRYEVINKIGTGGMATVYRAHDPRFNREVAIKVLPPELMHDKTFIHRFEREARTIAGLQHRHILPVYDFGEDNGRPFIVMAYLPGGSLRDLIRHYRSEMPLELTLCYIGESAEALDYTHHRGIIHRDYKPANVLLDENGSSYLADFGVVKLSEATAQLTGSGMVGTPAYMAPEMMDKGGLTHLIDVYALAITLFQMLAGRQPFEADTPLGLLMAHANKSVPALRDFRSDLPDAVQAVIEGGMAKDPMDRFQSAGALAAAFHEAVQDSVPPAEPVIDKPEVPPTFQEPEPIMPPAGLDVPPTFQEPEPIMPSTGLDAPTMDIGEEMAPPPARVVAPSEPAPIPRPTRRSSIPWRWIGGVGAVIVIGIVGLIALLGNGEPEPSTTEEPLQTEVMVAEEETPEPTARPSDQPIAEPARNPVFVLAETGVSANNDWEPYIRDFDGVPMALVPAGCFMMGSEDGESDESPAHEICFDEPFWMDVYEVTNGQYGPIYELWAAYSSKDNQPRIRVNWFASVAHCESRGARLPSEAEWEYAARGPDGLTYPWGVEFVSDNSVNFHNSEGRTWTVGSKPADVSWVGAYDMTGNVREWMNSIYRDYPYAADDGREVDGAQDDASQRVQRGASWDSLTPDFRSANRDASFPDGGMLTWIGFRCARSYDAESDQVEDLPTPTAIPLPQDVENLAFGGVAANADWTPYIHDFDGVQMALVPAGCFQMGSEDGLSEEKPVHEVCLDEPFWIDVYEVTNKQYGIASEDCLDVSSDGDQPRICIDWVDSVAHCESRGARLPTEAEWEYAARGPDALVYPWGNDFIADNAVYSDNAGGQTAPVGSKPGGISWVGAYDLSGNVWEWTNTIYFPDGRFVYPYDPDDGREAIDSSSQRVYRGGSWFNHAVYLRGAMRLFAEPVGGGIENEVASNFQLGFRCARSVEP